MTIIDDVQRERRAHLERFGRSPRVVTIPSTRRDEFGRMWIEAVKSGMVKGSPTLPMELLGMEVRFGGANAVVACSMK